MTSALVVDDHPLARRGISTILHDELMIETVYEAGDAARAIDLARSGQPSLVLMDLQMPDSLPPRELCAQLRSVLPSASIVILTAFNRGADIGGCLEAGANGCLLKDTPEEDLVLSLRGIIAGQTVMDPRSSEQIAMAMARSHGPHGIHLTPREREVLRELAEGRSNRQIAQRLVLSEATVKTYVSALLEKLDATSRLEAVVRAGDAGLL